MKLSDQPKSKFIKKFDNFSGIVKVYDIIQKKIVFVVYGYFMPEDLRNGEDELGDAIGKGDTKEEAMIDAIKHLVEMKRFTDNRLHEFVESIQSTCSIKSMGIDSHKVVLPIEDCDEIHHGNGTYEIRSNGKFHNSQVYLNEKDGTIYAASL